MRWTLLFLLSILTASEVQYLDQNQVCNRKNTRHAIHREDEKFVNDFVCIHALIRTYQPKTIMEIGTCTGEGTQIIANAMGRRGRVYSVELPPGVGPYNLKQIGNLCGLPYTQIIGNSLEIDYSQYYPLEAWFIDGSHDYHHVYQETTTAQKSNPKLIIWHDADIDEVFRGIVDGLDDLQYKLYRIRGTRIAYAIKTQRT